jgi:hypothetical protein
VIIGVDIASGPDRTSYWCALCKREVPGGGHPCITDGLGDPRPEEHLAMCGVCMVFHEPHCAAPNGSQDGS